MTRYFPRSLALLVALHSSLKAAAPEALFPEKHRAVLKQHCFSCHNAEKQKGKVRLDDLSFSIGDSHSAERWQAVLDAVNSGDMPPEDEKPLPTEAKTDLLDDLNQTLVVARKVLGDRGERATMRRLNRREYANTIRDLLGITIDTRQLPPDEREGAFDTFPTTLFMSSDQFELYRTTGKQAVTDAFRAAMNSPVKKKLVEPEVSANKFARDEIMRLVSMEKRFILWKKAVEAAASRPENAKAVAAAKEQFKANSQPVLLGWQSIKGAPSPSEFAFLDALAAVVAHNNYVNFLPTRINPLSLPDSDRGVYLGLADFDLPSQAPGDYTIRVRAARVGRMPLKKDYEDRKELLLEAPDPSRYFVELGDRFDHWRRVAVYEVTGTVESPQELVWKFRQEAGNQGLLQIRERGGLDRRPALMAARASTYTGFGGQYVYDPAVWIDSIEVEGPFHEPREAERLARWRTGLEKFDARTLDARGFINAFAAEALRGRQPTTEFLDRIAKRYDGLTARGQKPRDALVECLSLVLASPSFLYLGEPAAAKPGRELTDVELAARLSYFLWSAPPDAELLGLAKAGTLRQPAMLDKQVDRMLADERARGFIESFVSQWLGMSRLDFFQFNQRRFPDFDRSTKEAARREVYESFAHLLAHDGSLSHLLKSDTVVINSLLANYYGIAEVAGDEFRAVKVPADSPRGGLLGMAAIMAMGSTGEVTNPVERGAWVMRKLLNDPPPPAPPNVPQLSRLEGKLLTTRERLQMHQEQPQCASCHRRIDPIGFALENFDAVGKWRTKDSYSKDGVGTKTWDIETSGQFHRGPAFKNFFELRDLIAARADDFARGFSAALIEYALGHPAGFSDDPLIKTMTTEAKAKNFAPRTFIHTLIQSREFQTK
jgi:hypothetical protein